MANNYYDATGVILLDRVTPVITALFGAFNLDGAYPGKGQAYVARMSETIDPEWEDIRVNLVELANELGLTFALGVEPTIATCLDILAKHYCAEHSEDLEHLIERHSFEDLVDFESLFLIATHLDDGHGLSAIRVEGCWHCSKPRLFEFGGDGMFISREVTVYSNSTRALGLGQDLHNALQADEPDLAAARLAREVANLLAGIGDDATRALMQQKLAERLVQSSTFHRSI